jgi:hypothetical protein
MTHSIDDARDRGGRITEDGMIPLSELSELRRAGGVGYDQIFGTASPGEVRGPIEEGAERHVLLYLATTEQRVPTLEQVKDQADQGARQERVSSLIDELRANLVFTEDSIRTSQPLISDGPQP